MTSQEIYKLANELTSQEVDNILGGWDTGGDEVYRELYDTLVRLGDSKELAMATVLAKKSEN